MLCYGYVAAYADSAYARLTRFSSLEHELLLPCSLILSRFDVHVLHNLMPLMANAKTVLLKVNIIKALDLIGKALHVSRLPETKKVHTKFSRTELVAGAEFCRQGAGQTGDWADRLPRSERHAQALLLFGNKQMLLQSKLITSHRPTFACLVWPRLRRSLTWSLRCHCQFAANSSTLSFPISRSICRATRRQRPRALTKQLLPQARKPLRNSIKLSSFHFCQCAQGERW